MNTGLLQVAPRFGAAQMLTLGRTFQPTMNLAQEIGRAVNFIVDPARLLSESQERATKRSAMALATPIVERIRLFASAVVHGAQFIVGEASPLVRQEAARLAVFFAETGLDLTSDSDEVAMPSVHQTPSGAIQFEWHRKGIDLEVTVLPSGRITAYVEQIEHEPREVDLADGISLVEPELHAVLRR